MTIDSIVSGGGGTANRSSSSSADVSAAARAAAPRPSAAIATPAASATDTRTAVNGTEALPTKDELTKAVSDLNKAAQDNGQGLEFSIDQDSKRTVVKVVDTATKEVLRQFPSKEALQIAASLDKVQQGFLIKQTA